MTISLGDKISAVCAFGLCGLMFWGMTDLRGHMYPAVWWLILILVSGCAAVLFTYVVPEYIDRYLVRIVLRKRDRQRVAFNTLAYPTNARLSPPIRRTAIRGRTWMGALAAVTLTTALAGALVYRKIR